ncbi:MAG TPA: hypothetical protein VK327_06740, partial [Candidatus Paceibacterota bacterium]|nr:hypothetical protein [Candidatus Paceibacterota bacterium]
DIQGALIVIGSGNDTLNVDDSGDTAANSGLLVPATLTGLGLGSSITYSGLTALNVNLGSGDDTFTVNDMTNETVTTIDGGTGANSATLNFSQDFAAKELTLTRVQTVTLAVVRDFTGLLDTDGTITTVTIGGSLTSTGVLNAGAINTMTIGIDLAGLVNVTGLLDSLTVQGGTPGKIIAGDVHTIAVMAGYGSKVLQVIETGIERQIQALRVGEGSMDKTVTFAFLYDSVSSDVPQLVIRVTNSDPATVRFNLALVAHSATAQFNLARVEAVGNSGISNIAMEGDLLTAISQRGLDFLGIAADSTSGVYLPLDNITGVAVRDTLPIGHINVAGIEGLAFGFLVGQTGKPMTIQDALGSSGKPAVLWNILGSQAVLLPAADAFLIPFSEAHPVSFYAQADLDLSLDYIGRFTDQMTDNASVRAEVQMVPGATKKQIATITSIQFTGDGASIDSQYGIGSITSTGPLGDVTVRGASGLGSVTASGIFGNINVLSGAIYGRIETTGVRIDPITGQQTSANSNIGRVQFDAKGKLTGVTTIYSKLGISGSIISRGSLVSAVRTDGSITGMIASQGDIGLLLRDSNGAVVTDKSGKLLRYGGIFAKNGSSHIITLGNVFGDLSFKGNFSGRIAVQGATIDGLAAGRFGILGNVSIKTFAESGAVISSGLIGDASGRTAISVGGAKGFLAAHHAIALGKGSKLAASQVIQNLIGTENGSVLGAVFTDNSVALLFDTNGALLGLSAIQTDLAAIALNNGALGGTTP